MKRYTYFLSSVIGLTLFVGCGKFLDRPLENQPEATKIDYTNFSLMHQAVSGVYATASRGGFTKWIGITLQSVHSDDIEPGNDDAGQIAIHNFQNNVTVKSYWGINDLWISLYGVVLSANGALAELEEFGKNIPAGDAANSQLLAQYQAEVRFFRAYAHYMLSRLFGDVPLLNEDSNDPFNLANATKSTFEQVRQHVMDEMDFCVANLEDARPNQAAYPGSVTRYTALMLKAKAAMDLAGNDNASPYWDVVLNCTNDIITKGNFSLFEDYYQLFKKPGKLCNEALLEFQYSDFGNGEGDIVTSGTPSESWGNFYLFQGPENTYGAPINGPGWMIPTQKAVNFLSSRNDALRIKTVIQHCGVNGEPGTTFTTPDGDKVSGNAGRKKYFNGKSYFPKSQMTPGRTDYGANNNVRVFRYAEVLLMNAEAKIRKGQNGDAPLNEVRQRVLLNPIQGATLEQVLDERHAELICEWWGERFNDLVRTGKAAAELPGFLAGQSEFLPIPQAQSDVNSNF